MPAQGGQPLYPMRLAALDAVHPDADPAANVCTPAGDWGFFGEGGLLTFMDLRSMDTNNPGTSTQATPPVTNEYLLSSEVKRVQIGGVGVRPAEMLCHPDLDLSDDGIALAPDAVEDKDDLIFIAGGRMGLWVMEAHPHPSYANRAVRIDDSGNLNPSTQNSERYCNGLAFATIGVTDYLVALHAKGGANRVRFYDLSLISGIFAAADSDGLGGEITPTRQAFINARPNAPAESVFDANDPTPCMAVPYALDVDVHQCSPNIVDVYVAVGIHGLVRVNARQAAGGIATTVEWGPMFGTGCPGGHDVATNGTLNASGYPASRYRNFDWNVMARSQLFDSVTRSDPPTFVDVAVHAAEDGCRLYAAVDHLGWVRFDVSTNWNDSIPIEKHEGRDVSLQTSPEFDTAAWTRAGSPIKSTMWDPPLMTNFDLIEPPPVGRGGGSINYCHELDIIDVEVQAPGEPVEVEAVLAAQYRFTPWAAEGRAPRFGGFGVDNDHVQKSGVETAAKFMLHTGGPGRLEGRCAFHRVADIDAWSAPSLDFTWDGWVPDGGEDTYFPPAHNATTSGESNVIRFVHGRSRFNPVDTPPGTSPTAKLGGCLTFFRLNDGTPGAAPGLGLDRNAPVHARNVIDRTGRHLFYMGPSVIDSRIMLTSFSDSPFVKTDGLLYSPYDNGSGKWSLAPLDMINDHRGEAGAVAERTSQWIRDNDWWVWGGAGVSGVVHWEVLKHDYSPTGGANGAPICTLADRWTLSTPKDRWEHSEARRRPEHVGGVFNADYDAYTVANAPQGEPTKFMFASSASSADGVIMVGRDLMVNAIESTPPGDDVQFEDPRELPLLENPWDMVTFDTHPEWSNFPAIKFHDSDDNVVVTAGAFDDTLWASASDWWRPQLGGAHNIQPLQESALTCRNYPPRLLKLRSSASVTTPDTWVALIPCSHAVAPPTVVDSSGSAPVSGVLKLTTPPIDSSFLPDQVWLDNYDHGFLQIFDISDPWSIVAGSIEDVVNPANPTMVQRVIKPYRTDVDPLILTDPGGAAFRVETLEFTVDGATKTFAFVAEFSGKVEVFDITDALYRTSTGSQSPIFSWEAPLSVFDSYPNNIRAIAVDRLVNNSAMVYAGVSRMGIMSIPFSPASGFLDAERHLEKTPGEVWGLEIREDQDPTRRTLLCSDSYGGNRVYSLRNIDEQAQSGTGGL